MIEFPRCAFLAIATGLPLLAAGPAAADDQQTVYVRTDLVSNTANLVQPLGPQLQNAWGVANAPGGPLWISDNNDGLSTLYDGNGKKQGLVITIPLPPGRVAPPAAAPTGMVWNPTSGFTFTVGGVTAAAVFIFDSEDGTIVAWNPAVDPIAVTGQSTATIVVNNAANGAVYKGLAFGTNQHGNFLFATNFAAGTVEVYDKTFAPATLDGNFSDPNIPAGFAPFGIANIDNNLYVTYAKQNAQKNDVVAGAGQGFVDVFSTDGVLIKRFASRGALNAPWGVTRATQNFGQFSGSILIANFGEQGQFSGWINAFDGGNENDFLGSLRDAMGKPIAIDSPWAIVFGTFLNSDADTLYFTAGPNQQANGLFGKIVAQPQQQSAQGQ
ncbi:MAG TPA: TIGR03118 family protein [Xanthobacteraceae bacterium]